MAKKPPPPSPEQRHEIFVRINAEHDRMLATSSNSSLVEALRIMTLFEAGYSAAEVARYYGYTDVSSVHFRVNTMKKDGTWQRAEQIRLAAIRDQINYTNRRALQRYNDMVENLVRIATEGRSELAAIQAFNTLHSLLVAPMVENVADDDSVEGSYAVTELDDRPTQILLPPKVDDQPS